MKKYVFYSEKADQAHGHIIYVDQTGKEYKVTAFGCENWNSYGWDDKVFVGWTEDFKFLRSNKKFEEKLKNEFLFIENLGKTEKFTEELEAVFFEHPALWESVKEVGEQTKCELD